LMSYFMVWLRACCGILLGGCVYWYLFFRGTVSNGIYANLVVGSVRGV